MNLIYYRRAYKAADEGCLLLQRHAGGESSAAVTSPVDTETPHSPQSNYTHRTMTEGASATDPDDTFITDTTDDSEESSDSQNGTNENSPIANFIPLFSKPLPMPPTTESMLEDASFCMSCLYTTFFL